MSAWSSVSFHFTKADFNHDGSVKSWLGSTWTMWFHVYIQKPSITIYSTLKTWSQAVIPISVITLVEVQSRSVSHRVSHPGGGGGGASLAPGEEQRGAGRPEKEQHEGEGASQGNPWDIPYETAVYEGTHTHIHPPILALGLQQMGGQTSLPIIIEGLFVHTIKNINRWSE